MKEKIVLIAIGGNSLIKSEELQRVEDQHQAIGETVQLFLFVKLRSKRPWMPKK
jgi:carbamate kinase